MFRSMMFAMMVLVSVCAADTYDSVFVHVYIDDVEYDRYFQILNNKYEIQYIKMQNIK